MASRDRGEVNAPAPAPAIQQQTAALASNLEAAGVSKKKRAARKPAKKGKAK